jgi:tRNA G18 (ribose-2'-O)-methylase SpoU
MAAIAPVSASDPELAVFRTLRSGGPTLPAGCFIGDGGKVVRRMLDSTVRLRRILLTEEWLERLRGPIEARSEPDLRVLVAPPGLLDGVVGFRLHQGLMALAEIPAPPAAPGDFVVALDGVARDENVGSIVRSCAAFGVTGVLVGPATCSPWARRAVRVSMGAVLRVPIRPVEDLAAAIGALGVPAYAGDIRGERQRADCADLSGPVCLVIGGEAAGVTPAVLAACRARIWIPMEGGWDCLNAASAAAVLLYETARQKGEKSKERRNPKEIQNPKKGGLAAPAPDEHTGTRP